MDSGLDTKRRFPTVAILVAAVVLTLVAVAGLMLSPRSASAVPQRVSIPPAVGALGVGRTLEHAGIIRSAWTFRMYVALAGLSRSLKAGDYELCACNSTQNIAQSIARGDALSDDISITVPEGMNVWELDRLAVQKLSTVPGRFSATYGTAEGHLLPDTYRLHKDAGFNDFGSVLTNAFMLLKTQYNNDQVIVASILEKEAKSAGDMNLVAGIIAARRKLDMPLQVDATVAYGWCVRTAGFTRPCNVTQAPIASELKVDGPYNTYTRKGLPAGPISNPGLVALESAAHPSASGYLYYLSTPDGSQLIYSKTLEEHLANRAKYLGF